MALVFAQQMLHRLHTLSLTTKGMRANFKFNALQRRRDPSCMNTEQVMAVELSNSV